ncbi:hypothetical protein ACHQM5_028684 [Ranunculus cassubicifolius]
MAPSLVGPPALHNQSATNKPSSSSSSSAVSDPFMDLMVANFNKPKHNLHEPNYGVPGQATRGVTENFSATFVSTSNPCLDFFFHVVPSTPAQTLRERLELAWKHNDLMALKLICHLRGVRGTGKSDKEGFYTAALWLHKHHPKTLACNVKWMADFGYFKDLPEILYRILEGPEVRTLAREAHATGKKPGMTKVMRVNRRGKKYNINSQQHSRPYTSASKSSSGKSRGGRRDPRDKRLAVEMKRVNIQKEKARDLRKEKQVSKARKAFERYSRDPEFKFLHDQISQVFADRLVEDMNSMKAGEMGKISLAAKWCPSLDSAYDKATLLCESIAKRVFSRENYPEYEEIEEAHYAFRVRDRLRKQVLVPLRQILELPETYMSSNQWNALPYNRVPSVAMSNYKKHFLKHDETRFNEFLGKVEKGEAKIAAGALLPHEIIKQVNDGQRDGGQVADLQWKRMVEDLLAKGKLKNCIGVCDVSGSMAADVSDMHHLSKNVAGTPMEVCVALGLLLSELSEHPWNGKVIVFHENPELHIIKGNDLYSKTEFIRRMKWGCNTDFQKVFDLILQVAINGRLSKEQMIKRVFVFSDMEFDEARGRKMTQEGWETDYQVITRKFEERGYELPELVFWNLRDSLSTPVANDQKRVALVSGFSKNMMTMFLDEQDLVSEGPEAVMELAISGPEYKELVVLD